MIDTTDTGDRLLDGRLAALEAALPAPTAPPSVIAAGRRRIGRRGLAFIVAPVALFAMVVTAAAGAALLGSPARGAPGIQNPGQPLAGANLECMSPPMAAAFLEAHGFHSVVWQVESGDPTTGGPKGDASSRQQSTPPIHGFVIPGALLPDGRVIMVVDQRVGATGVGACFGRPMP